MNHSRRNYPVLIGSTGWQHPAWCDDYYPADLPADWQLAYYANEFPVLLVPAGTALPEAFGDEADLDLQLVFELTAAGTSDLQQQLAQLPAVESRHLLLRTNLNLAPQALSELLDILGEEMVCVDFGSAAPAARMQELLTARQVGWCWHGTGEADGLAVGRLGIARIEAGAATPLQLRHWVQTCLAAASPERSQCLLFEGRPPAVETLRQAQLILDLL
jgi:hypothetical protein